MVLFVLELMMKTIVIFNLRRDLGKGVPLHPLSSIWSLAFFTKNLNKVSNNSLISGLMPNVYQGGIVSLQYADDTILFLENDIVKARNLKWLLDCFESLLGMRINKDKCDLLTIDIEEKEENSFSRHFYNKRGTFPLKYLGAPFILLSSKERTDNQ